MSHCAPFHLVLHCLSKYQLWGFQHTKGLSVVAHSISLGGESVLLYFNYLLKSCECLLSVFLPHSAVGWSAFACDFGTSWSY